MPITAEHIQVECVDIAKPDIILFKKILLLIQPSESVDKLMNTFKTIHNATRAPSVLILGLSNVGRLNMRRTMPNAYKFLTSNRFYDYQGYTAVGHDSYSNFMAVLAGMNVSKYDCAQSGLADMCPIIWKAYKQSGYATALFEDSYKMDTLIEMDKRFTRKPVDYFGVPGMKMLEELMLDKEVCVEDRYIAEYPLNLTLNFATLYKEQPYFGVFWTKSLTSHDVRHFMALDRTLTRTFIDMKKQGILNDAIVIVMGDHGFPTRPYVTLPGGWYDFRLPALFISLPKWYKKKYPIDDLALKYNRNQLISPYDVHATLKEILIRSNRANNATFAKARCAKCQSLFYAVPQNRTCGDIGVIPGLCPCSLNQELNPSEKSLVKEAAEFAVKHMNSLVEQHLKSYDKNKDFCMELKLKNLTFSGKMDDDQFMIEFETSPGTAMYQAVVVTRSDGQFTLIGKIVPLDRINENGHCVMFSKNKVLMDFCVCSTKLVTILAKERTV